MEFDCINLMSQKQTYHHGNLRQALVAAAIQILESEGLKSLSLRRIAREAGVSQAAPYGHFKDKDELLLAVCAMGYEKFSHRMREEAGVSTGSAYIAGLGRGYIYFALENPALFELMFSGNFRDNPDMLMEDMDPVFSEGYNLLDEGLSRYPIPYLQDDRISRAISWGVVHGIASLLLSQRMRADRFGFASVDEFIHDCMDKFAGGVDNLPLSSGK